MMLWRRSRVASDITHVKNSSQPFALKGAVLLDSFTAPFLAQGQNSLHWSEVQITPDHTLPLYGNQDLFML